MDLYIFIHLFEYFKKNSILDDEFKKCLFKIGWDAALGNNLVIKDLLINAGLSERDEDCLKVFSWINEGKKDRILSFCGEDGCCSYPDYVSAMGFRYAIEANNFEMLRFLDTKFTIHHNSEIELLLVSECQSLEIIKYIECLHFQFLTQEYLNAGLSNAEYLNNTAMIEHFQERLKNLPTKN